jgi:hypothetical protein
MPLRTEAPRDQRESADETVDRCLKQLDSALFLYRETAVFDGQNVSRYVVMETMANGEPAPVLTLEWDEPLPSPDETLARVQNRDRDLATVARNPLVLREQRRREREGRFDDLIGRYVPKLLSAEAADIARGIQRTRSSRRPRFLAASRRARAAARGAPGGDGPLPEPAARLVHVPASAGVAQ